MKKMSELVSVIITSYNHAEYLKQRLDTIIAQTYKNLEIIVIDDCSSDNSLDILKEYADLSNIKIVAFKKNEGYAFACRSGVQESKGDYIMFAESDDFSEPEQIETLLREIVRDKNIGVVWCRSNIVDENGKVIGDDYSGREKAFRKMCLNDAYIKKEFMQKFFLPSCVIPNMSAALIRKSFFEKTGGLSSDFKVCADWDFWNRMARVSDFFYVAKALNNFRTHQKTVRNTCSSNIQVREIFKLVDDASGKVYTTLVGRIKAKLNFGYIGAYMIIYNSGHRRENAIFIYREGTRYIQSFFFFLLAGFLINAYEYIEHVLLKKLT
jgi:glycosyltransferase involved in cell wall biosynthesis